MTSLASEHGNVMANEGDPGWWIAPAVGLSGIAIGAIGWFAKSLALAWTGGSHLAGAETRLAALEKRIESTADNEGRLERIEERQKLNMEAILAYQTRTDLAITGLRAKGDIIDGELRNVATRSELKEDLKPILDEIREIRRAVFTERRGFMPPTIP